MDGQGCGSDWAREEGLSMDTVYPLRYSIGTRYKDTKKNCTQDAQYMHYWVLERDIHNVYYQSLAGGPALSPLLGPIGYSKKKKNIHIHIYNGLWLLGVWRTLHILVWVRSAVCLCLLALSPVVALMV